MKLYEYDAKRIFSRYGIPVPVGELLTDASGAVEISGKLGQVVVKAQVLVGGRGKAGGILVASTPQEAVQNAKRIFGMSIKGTRVKKILLEEYEEPLKEMYLGITIDRKERCPIIMASTEGGVDIEETALRYPEKISRMKIASLAGIHEYQARNLANSLDGDSSGLIADVIKKLYRVFTEYDCTLAEINPLALTKRGIFALDAKISIDDNALFRQEFEEEQEEDELSEKAKRSGMSYVGLGGDIGCIVNGAGLAMATLDMIQLYKGSPANFMDVRAGANEEQIKTALRIVSSNKNVTGIIINIFGGLTKCDEAARGIIDVSREIKIPLFIRLAGTNEEKGRKMLQKFGLTIAASTEEVAREAVKIGHSHQ
jgi:succinyl-CoA synthetase beta subunit